MVEFITGALAVWRLSRLLHKEAGPYDIFAIIRDKVGITYDQRNIPFADNELGKVFLCMWCLSVWVGFGIAASQRRGIVRGLAYSTAALLIEKYMKGESYGAR